MGKSYKSDKKYDKQKRDKREINREDRHEVRKACKNVATELKYRGKAED